MTPPSRSSGRSLWINVTFPAAERAVRSGDAAQLKALLTQILSTNEGKALAEKLSRFENGK